MANKTNNKSNTKPNTKSNYTNLALLIFVIVLLVLVLNKLERESNENWVNYKEISSGNIQNAPDPLLYYVRTKHRLPYRYPACINVDYPIPHCRTFDELTN